jgi:hypothetical protein
LRGPGSLRARHQRIKRGVHPAQSYARVHLGAGLRHWIRLGALVPDHVGLGLRSIMRSSSCSWRGLQLQLVVAPQRLGSGHRCLLHVASMDGTHVGGLLGRNCHREPCHTPRIERSCGRHQARHREKGGATPPIPSPRPTRPAGTNLSQPQPQLRAQAPASPLDLQADRYAQGQPGVAVAPSPSRLAQPWAALPCCCSSTVGSLSSSARCQGRAAGWSVRGWVSKGGGWGWAGAGGRVGEGERRVNTSSGPRGP